MMNTEQFTPDGPRRKPRRRLALSATALAFALLAAACGDDGGDDASDTTAAAVTTATTAGSGTATSAAPTTAAAAQPKSGGKVRYAINTITASFDPITVAARVSDAGNYGYPVFGSLVDVDYETGAKLTMNMAKSLETTDAGLTWTLVLKDGIKFSDGEPYNAEAVKFNWDRYLAKAPAKSLGAQAIESFTVVDPLTIKVTLKAAQPQWPLILGPLVFIGSPKAINEKGDGFAKAPVGAGPFLLKEFITDTSVTLVRNPTYFEAGLPYLDEVQILNIPDPSRRMDALIAGEVDVAQSRPDGVDRLKSAGLVRFPAPNDPSYGGSGLVFNTAKAPFDDKAVRCAVINSIDVDQMNKNLSAGNAIGNPDGTAFREFVHRGPASEGAKRYPPTDKAAVQKAFDDYAAKTGGPVKFLVTGLDSNKVETEYMLTQWQTYKNLEVTSEFKTVPELVAYTQQQGGHQVAVLGWGSGDVPAGFSLVQFGRSKDGKAQLFTGYTSPAFDAALDAYATATDDAARNKALRDAQDFLIGECLYMPYPRASIGHPYGKAEYKNWALNVYSVVWEDIWLDK